MDEWSKAQNKKWAPLYKKAIDDFNKNGYKRLVAMRHGVDPNNKNYPARISQRSLSSILDILQQNYNKIEKGKINGGNNVTLEQAIKLSLFYGCTIDYIAYGKEVPDSLKPLEDNERNKIVRILEDNLKTEKEINAMLRAKIQELERGKR